MSEPLERRNHMSIGVLLLASTIICPKPNQTPLPGLWESSTTSRGGIGHTLEFRPDGTFVEAVTIIVDLRYRVDGRKLYTFEPGASPSEDQFSTIKLMGSRLLETAFDGSQTEKVRLADSPSAARGLVGAWSYRHYTGAIAFERYTPDGQLLFRLPMSSSVGCFVPHGKELTLAEPNKPEGSLSYEIQGDNLILTEPEGKVTRYRKSSYGPWYDREHIDYKPPK